MRSVIDTVGATTADLPEVEPGKYIVYKDRPVSIPRPGGPMLRKYSADKKYLGTLMHPGFYTFSDVIKLSNEAKVRQADGSMVKRGTTFQKWLASPKVGPHVRVLDTNKVRGAQWASSAADPLLGYDDVLFVTDADLVWPATIDGIVMIGGPTWLPPRIGANKEALNTYWGSHEEYMKENAMDFSDILAELGVPTDTIKGVTDTLKGLATVAVFGVGVYFASQFIDRKDSE